MKDVVKVCQLSDAHALYDDRIYWKYALSLKKNGYEVTYIAPHTENIDFITNEGVRLIGVENKLYFKNRILNKLYKVVFRKDIKRILFNLAKSCKADIYHFHNINLIGTGKKLKKLRNTPVVIYDSREPYYHNIKDAMLKPKIPAFLRSSYAKFIDKKEKRLAKRFFDFVISNEDNVANFFKPYVGSNKAEAIYNFSNLNSDYERLDWEKKIYDVIYCGNISKNRGAFTILQVANYLKQKKENVKFLLLGSIHDKNFKQEMFEYISMNKLDENVKIKNSVPYKEVHNYYLHSKIGVMLFKPFDTYKIILPIKTFEYMAYGLPVVCSNFGQIQDYTLKYNVGITVEYDAIGEISDAIIKILNDKNLYYSYSDNGINTSKTEFRWEKMEKKLVDIYEKVIAKQKNKILV